MHLQSTIGTCIRGTTRQPGSKPAWSERSSSLGGSSSCCSSRLTTGSTSSISNPHLYGSSTWQSCSSTGSHSKAQIP